MKKIFSKVAIVATILLGGFSMTSCGSDDLWNAIEQALTIWQQINAGQTVQFNGTSTIKHVTNAGSGYTYNASTGVATKSSHDLSLTVKSNQAAITVGDFTVEGYTISNLNITAITYNNGTIGDSDMEYAYACTYTISKDGSVAYGSTPSQITSEEDVPYVSAYGTIDSDGVLDITIVLQVATDEAFTIDYKGSQVTQ